MSEDGRCRKRPAPSPTVHIRSTDRRDFCFHQDRSRLQIVRKRVLPIFERLAHTEGSTEALHRAVEEGDDEYVTALVQETLRLRPVLDVVVRQVNRPVEIAAAPRNAAADRVRQTVYPVDKQRKRELLSHRIGTENWRQVLVFARTKHGADRLARQLGQDGIQSMAIHGRKTQSARTRALADFKAGKVRVLVATDVAARGLDIERLPHVINYELPDVPEDYVHRIGRTARAGQEGHAISLVCVDELPLLRGIERLLQRKIDREIVPGYEVDPRIAAEPLSRGRSRQQETARPSAGHRQTPRGGAGRGQAKGRGGAGS